MKRKIFTVLLMAIFLVCTACAIAACIPDVCTLRYRAGEGGYIEGSACQSVRVGEDGDSVAAVAESGYEFVDWSDGVLTPERRDLSVSESIDVTARFEFKGNFVVIYRATEGGYIDGKAEQWGDYGESTSSVTAVAEEGYCFDRWSDGVLAPERSDEYGENGGTLIAYFVKNDTERFAGGIGSQSYPYLIGTSEHLNNVKLFPDAHFKMIADITLPAAAEGQSNFTPIGSKDTPFIGEFDGDGHTISGLTIRGETDEYVGMFGRVDGAVRGVELTDLDITGGKYVGGIAAICYGEITDCNVSGDIMATPVVGAEEAFVGGVAGYLRSYTDTKEYRGLLSAVNIVVAETDVECYVGGVFGQVFSDFSLSESSFSGDINADWVRYSVGRVRSGGLVGMTYGLPSGESVQCVSDSSAAGRLNGGFVGGIIGTACPYGQIYISDSSSSADVEGVFAGGFVCGISNASVVTMERCNSTGNVVTYGNGAGFIDSVSADSACFTDCYSKGRVYCRRNDEGYSLYLGLTVGGFIGILSKNSNLTRCAFSSDIVMVNDAQFTLGGLVGMSEGNCTYESCFANGDISVEVMQREGTDGVLPEMQIMAGGLFGRLMNEGNVVNNCYFSGFISFTDENNVLEKVRLYSGGMAADAGIVKISNSYFCASFMDYLDCDEITRFIGAVAGWAYSVNLNDDVYYPPVYRYEVAYNHEHGMPWYWNGRYTDFDTLAAVLNEGQETVWENTDDGSSPSLIWWNELSASGKEPTE